MEYVLYDGSHLVMAGDFTANHVIGDGRSMLHMAHNSTLKVVNEVTSHVHIYEGADLFMETLNEVVFISYVYVNGFLTLAVPEEQNITLTSPARMTIESLGMPHLRTPRLTVGTNTSLNVINDELLFDLNTEDIIIEGNFSVSGNITIHGLRSFTVGTLGKATLNPTMSEMYLGSEIDIRGIVTLGRHVNIVQPCTQFLIELGQLSWPATEDIITIECDIVNINGPFSPGTVSFGSGVQHFTVGANGVFTMTADGPIIAESVAVSGTMNVNNLVDFRATNGTDPRIATFVINYPSGLLELNKLDLPKQENGVTLNDTDSTLHVSSLTIDKTFTADVLSLGDGADDISVNRFGVWTFTPSGEYRVDTFYSNGTITASAPVTFRGYATDKIREVFFEYGARVTLDNLAQSSKAWTGVSTLPVHEFKLYGDLFAGKLTNHIDPSEGWDRLDMNLNGSMYFLPEGDFLIDYMYVNGHFESYGAINMSSADTELLIHIDTRGKMKFDSLISANWESESKVVAGSIQMESGSNWVSGNTNWVVTTFDISGVLTSHPYSDTQIVYLTINSGGNVDFTRPNTIKGFDFTIASGGLMQMFYGKQPDDATQGCEATRLLYKTVTIAGTARAGSMYIGHLGDDVQFCKTVVISGTLDVSGGGYLYDQGPGE